MGLSLNRRRFAKTAAAAAAFAPALHLTAGQLASNRLRLGLIGCGGRGRQLLEIMRGYDDVDFAAISDVIEPRMDQAARMLAEGPRPQKPELVVEYERMLERKDIDAVLIAATQHWHGLPMILAAQAGKHVFVEKPLSHTIVEGRAMIEAVKKYRILAMMGTQQHGYPHFLKALEIVRSGQLGKIALVECWNFGGVGRRVGRNPDGDPPPGYHWDRWLGPAPWVPFNQSRLNNAWWFDYSGGMLTNWAIHYIDIVLAAMNVDSPLSVTCVGGKLVVDDLADTPDTIEASWEFPGFLLQYCFRGFNNFRTVQSRTNNHGICFHGTKATLVLDRNGYELYADRDATQPVEQEDNSRRYRDGKPGNEVDGPWQRLFVDMVKQGGPSPLDLEHSHRATVCCHLGNIAYLTKRRIGWDGQNEKIRDDAEASALLARPRRKGYELPSA